MDLTPFEWFRAGAWLASAVAAVAVWIWVRERASAIAAAVDEQGLAYAHRRIDDESTHAHQRFEQGAALYSKLSSYVQELPTRREHAEMMQTVTHLRDQCVLLGERIATLEARR